MDNNNSSLDFADVIRGIKGGKKYSRKNWNGKGQFIYFVPASSYAAQTEVAKAEFGDMVPYTAYLAIKTVDAYVAPWVASQTDLLAEDWFEVED